MESRLEILDRLSIKWGLNHAVTSFEEFTMLYDHKAVLQLVYIAMEEYAQQSIKRQQNKQ